MLKLINIGAYNGQSQKNVYEVSSEIVKAINNNSSVFTAEIEPNFGYRFNITSYNINITKTGFYTSANNIVPTCGLVLAINDEKEFLIISPRVIMNTQYGEPETSSNGFVTTNSAITSSKNIMCSTGKDVNGNNFTCYPNPDNSLYQGISSILDIGQHGTDEYTTEGDFILRQGAIRNHIVQELFFSMTRLGSCGDIIEKDGHQYTCISGPIFYQIS